MPGELERHRRNQIWHFRKRMRRRFRHEISEADYEAIIHRIREDKPGVVFLQLRNNGRSCWRVRWRRRHIVVVYDHRTECLVTGYRYQPHRWK